MTDWFKLHQRRLQIVIPHMASHFSSFCLLQSWVTTVENEIQSRQPQIMNVLASREDAHFFLGSATYPQGKELLALEKIQPRCAGASRGSQI